MTQNSSYVRHFIHRHPGPLQREVTAAVDDWISKSRPGLYCYRDRATCFDAAYKAFLLAGHDCSPADFVTALAALGHQIENHINGYKLVLDARLT